MFTFRRRLRALVWLAMAAMLAMSVLPTLAHAWTYTKAGPGLLNEICTPQGAQWVDADGKLVDADAPAGGGSLLEHCPYCLKSPSAAGMPPAMPLLERVTPSGTAAPPLFLHAPRTLFAWASAQPRAPPRLS